MNPYENDEEIIQPVAKKVEIWLDNGKKKQTFISGLVYPMDELKEHLKILKKKVAGNGSIKENDENKKDTKKDNEESEEIEETQIEYIIQLQGSHVEIVHEYFKNLGIKDISIRG